MDIWNVYGATNEVVATGSANVTANVTGGFQLGALAGQSTSLTLAYFAAGDPATASDFTATIAWGDGSTTSATVTSAGPGLFAVTGSHSYAAMDIQTATITVTDAVVIRNRPPAPWRSATSTPGPWRVDLATFTGVSGTSYSVSIDWGDSIPHPGHYLGHGHECKRRGDDHREPHLRRGQHRQDKQPISGAGHGNRWRSTLDTTVPVEVTRPPAFLIVANVPAKSGTILTARY